MAKPQHASQSEQVRYTVRWFPVCMIRSYYSAEAAA
jgi:hypothetical protein